MVVRRIQVASLAKVAGVLYAFIGLVAGLIIACVSLLGAGFMSQAKDGEWPAAFGAFLGVGAIVIAPIFYGLLGVIVGAFVAAVYNLAAGMIGGVQLDVE